MQNTEIDKADVMTRMLGKLVKHQAQDMPKRN
jgi:hypothetical protein